MSEYGKPSNDGSNRNDSTVRWRKILALHPETDMYDLVTNESYKVGQFKVPIEHEHSYKVEEFEVINPIANQSDRVHVKTLRLLGDGMKCSLMKPFVLL